MNTTTLRRNAWLCALAVAVLAFDARSQERRRPGSRRPTAPTPPSAQPAAPAATPQPVKSWTAVVGGDVHVGDGDILRRATVLIGDDKIVGVGHDVEIPAGAARIDASNRVVAPGFVAVHASGLGAPGRVTGNTRDSLNPFDPSMKMALAAGITSFLATFDRGTAAPGGQTAIIKLAFGDLDRMLVAEHTAYSMRVPLGRDQWHKLREQVAKVRSGKPAEQTRPAGDGDGGEGKGDGEGEAPKSEDSGSSGRADGDKAIREILAGKARLWIDSNGDFGTNEVRQALEIARLFGHGVVLDGPITAWTNADEIAATGSMVVLNPRDGARRDPGRPETTGANIAAAAILAAAGVPIAVTPPGGRFGGATVGTGGILGQDLHTLALDAAFAVRGGLDNRKALRTLTLDAARMVGAETRLGSLAPGKDADILILDGDPLHYRTFVQTALVSGKVVYEKDKEPFYRRIQR
jgi:imidazolonepropionase-like amidohydrolase